MPSTPKQTTGRGTTILLLVSLLLLQESMGNPIITSPEQELEQAALKGILEGLEHQGLAVQVVPVSNDADMAPPINIVDPTAPRPPFRKYVNPSDYRLRYGKRSVPIVPFIGETRFPCQYYRGKAASFFQRKK